MHVLEDRQPRHQPRRQRRAAGRIRIDGSEPLLEEAPLDRPGELRHWMIKVDDLVELALNRSLCPVCRRSFGRMKAPVAASTEQGNHARGPDQFARKPVHNECNPANTITSRTPKLTMRQGLGSFSRATPIEAAWPIQKVRSPNRWSRAERSAFSGRGPLSTVMVKKGTTAQAMPKTANAMTGS